MALAGTFYLHEISIHFFYFLSCVHVCVCLGALVCTCVDLKATESSVGTLLTSFETQSVIGLEVTS